MQFPQGEYPITSPIVIEDGTVVEGAGIGATIISINSPNSYAFVVNLGVRPRVRPVEFRNMTITSPTVRTAGAGILFQGQPSGIRHKVENVHIKNQDTGIHFADAVAFTVRDCMISHYGSRGIVVQNRIEGDAGDSCIDNVLFNDNNRTAQAAIYQQDSGGLNIVNCKMLWGDYGYMLRSVDKTATGQLTMIGNSMEHQSQAGVSIGGKGSFNVFQILGNHFTAPRHGIVVESHHRGRIDNNVVVGGFTGIVVSGGSEWSLTGNSIYDSEVGINIGREAQYCRVINNRIKVHDTPVLDHSSTSTWDGVS